MASITKKAQDAAIAENKIFHISYSMAAPMPILLAFLSCLVLRHHPLSGIHSKITEGRLDFINTILCRH